MKKLIRIIALVFALLMLASLPLAASKPYQTYTYSIDGVALHSPDAYTPLMTVDSKYMGLPDDAALKDPRDLEVDEYQNVYVVDYDEGYSRVICLDKYYKLREDVTSDGTNKGIIASFTNQYGVKDALDKPSGVFITKDKKLKNEATGEDEVVEEGEIFVCDTGKNRIVVFKKDGTFARIINRPESELFDENDKFEPVAMTVDQYGRLFVVSRSTKQGIIVMTAEGEFTKFIGAQKVTASAWKILMRRFMSEEQREQSEALTSTAYNNIAITEEGFIYITTSGLDASAQLAAITSKAKTGDNSPVKLINASGDEIMRRNGFWPPVGEIDVKITMEESEEADEETIQAGGSPSEIIDVAVGPENTWSIIDAQRSKVYTYDYDGNLLFAFGDKGDQVGNIQKITAITYQEEKMLILDKGDTKSSFTVFARTDYGNILIQALTHQNERRFDLAIEDWTEVLKRNSNFDAAYVGIGKAYYRSGEKEVEEGVSGYEKSLSYFQSAYDTENYSLAFKEIRKEWIGKFIWLIPIVIVAAYFLITRFTKYAAKVNKETSLKTTKRTFKEELLYVFHVMAHPFDGFWDLKHEKRGSVRASIVFVVITILAYWYKAIGQGYIMNTRQGTSSPITWVISVVVTVALWTIANWCLTTLFDGEGSLKDIFIAVSYSLLPVPMIMIPCTLASNFIINDEKDILTFIETLGLIYMCVLVFIGMMVTHDYTMGKNIITTAGTIIGVVFIMFIVCLFATLLTKIIGFVSNIVVELRYRM